ncbi:MAG: alpha/beta hydrolase [Actinobacteria bacterium]|nr:alpha/beta hydrolase [Ilumatobacteraceae bacterium]MDA0203675.1 alpha/beta hydrolase [Actinomycetota bacterium]
MTLDPSAQSVLSVFAESNRPSPDALPIDEAREGYAVLSSLGGTGAEVASVDHRRIAGVPCVVVTPIGAGPHPVIVWFHGGGWVLGSAEQSTPVTKDLAAAVGCVVVTVDYRLAPEHPAPAAMVDCSAVTAWVIDHGAEEGWDSSRVAVGGDSAGGNLAALVAQEQADALRAQLLVYPATDLTRSSPSHVENGEGFVLTARVIDWFVKNYLGGTGIDPADPTVSPAAASSRRLSHTARAAIITAGYDPLRDEGRAYAKALRAAGVTVDHREWEGQFHPFFNLRTLIPEAGEAIDWLAAQAREAFA